MICTDIFHVQCSLLAWESSFTILTCCGLPACCTGACTRYILVISSKIWNKRLEQFTFLIHLERLFAVAKWSLLSQPCGKKHRTQGTCCNSTASLGNTTWLHVTQESLVPSFTMLSISGRLPFCPSGPGIKHFRKPAALPGSEGGGSGIWGTSLLCPRHRVCHAAEPCAAHSRSGT